MSIHDITPAGIAIFWFAATGWIGWVWQISRTVRANDEIDLLKSRCEFLNAHMKEWQANAVDLADQVARLRIEANAKR